MRQTKLLNNQNFKFMQIFSFPKHWLTEVEESIKLGYNKVKIGFISKKTKGIVLINENYQVRGAYPTLFLEVIKKHFKEIEIL